MATCKTKQPAHGPDLLAGDSAPAGRPSILAQLESGGVLPSTRLPASPRHPLQRSALAAMFGVVAAIAVVMIARQIETSPRTPDMPDMPATLARAPAPPADATPPPTPAPAGAITSATIVSLPLAAPDLMAPPLPATPARPHARRQTPGKPAGKAPARPPAAVPDHDVTLLTAMVAHRQPPAPAPAPADAAHNCTGRHARDPGCR